MTIKRILLATGVLLAISATAYAIFFRDTKSTNDLIVDVKKSDFEVNILTTGELRSKSMTMISAPTKLRQLSIYQIKIADMVPEGTLVKEGAFVVSLDNSDVLTKIKDQQLNIDKKNAEIKQASLDTMMELRTLRDEIVNLGFELEQKVLEKEQSRYEAPAEIKRVQLEYEKAERTLRQKKDNYKTKQIQTQTKMQILGSDLKQLTNYMDGLTGILSQLTITAPKSGMLVYDKDWNGQKKAVGTLVELWNPTLATLPDLTQMEVLTYVNEVDIQKVKVGQTVDIGLDAAADKKLKGVVKSVANIGEEKPNSDAKVFEVLIDVLTEDPILKPAMTVSCKIAAEKYRDALQLPLETIYNDANGSFIFKRTGGSLVKQYVKVFTVNESNALITNGLKEGDRVYHSLPSDTTGLKIFKPDSTAEVKPRQLILIDSAEAKRLKEKGDQDGKTPRGGSEGGIILID
ncbi:MAG TPA: efflux RND transporter periplasmic adaptor subunit [Agriterribacter sp.]|nr:efflux RND transporter periplasmic adaptor subunit [Chitinophagaceae bacterium]HRP33557.1 efflux RND transporter periplasmic adaptor subunit [Agriterribacter sp.]